MSEGPLWEPERPAAMRWAMILPNDSFPIASTNYLVCCSSEPFLNYTVAGSQYGEILRKKLKIVFETFPQLAPVSHPELRCCCSRCCLLLPQAMSGRKFVAFSATGNTDVFSLFRIIVPSF